MNKSSWTLIFRNGDIVKRSKYIPMRNMTRFDVIHAMRKRFPGYEIEVSL